MADRRLLRMCLWKKNMNPRARGKINHTGFRNMTPDRDQPQPGCRGPRPQARGAGRPFTAKCNLWASARSEGVSANKGEARAASREEGVGGAATPLTPVVHTTSFLVRMLCNTERRGKDRVRQRHLGLRGTHFRINSPCFHARLLFEGQDLSYQMSLNM